jgi:hypothetical protein
MISLYCYDRPLLLGLVSLERKEPNKIRIVGRMFGQNTRAGQAP